MRRTDWPQLLSAFLEENATRGFDWQEQNCAFFACNWLALATGIDPASNERDLSARQLLAFHRKHDLAAVVAERAAMYGWPLLRGVAWAQRGDLVQIETDTGPALGICVGRHCAFAGEKGLLYRKLDECSRAWRIS